MDIIGTAAREYLYGTDQNDRILGGEGDFAVGFGGDDILAGASFLVGGHGNDTYYIQNTGQVVVENANEGTDTALMLMDPSSGAYTLPDNVEVGVILTGSTLFGNGLDNTLFGNDATNFLVGGAGSDTLAPGYGADFMVGGPESDTFTLTNGDVLQLNGDTITDWTDDVPHVAGDVINVSTSDLPWDFIGNAPFHGGPEIRIEEVHQGNEGSTLVEFGVNGVVVSTLTLDGIHHLNASDFVL